VDVNTDVALWAPLYASTLLTLLYSASLLLRANWATLAGLAAAALMWCMDVVARLVDTFVYRWEFMQGGRV
jgi:hypothetical protein